MTDKNMTYSKDISIIVPTYKRPQDIVRALNSVLVQDTKDYSYEIVVADNDPAASAHHAVHKLIDAYPQVDLIYIHVPDPGVSNARNGALACASGRYLIFLDDDMEAEPDWAYELMRGAERFDSPIVFGPVESVMPDGDDPLYPYMQPIFSRTGDFPEGHITKTFGTGGCLIDLGRCTLPTPAFDPALNETGGEDDAMFAYLIDHGATIGWTHSAIAVEHIPTHRSTPSYVWKRNFAFGQGPARTAADRGIKGIPEVLKWMCVGAVQCVLYGAQYTIRRLRGRADYINSYARLSQSFGKMFWYNGFSPRLYGVSSPTPEPSTAKDSVNAPAEKLLSIKEDVSTATSKVSRVSDDIPPVLKTPRAQAN